MAYQPLPSKTDGLIREVTTSDDDAGELLKDILIELKIISKHLTLMTDTEIQTEDV